MRMAIVILWKSYYTALHATSNKGEHVIDLILVRLSVMKQQKDFLSYNKKKTENMNT